MTTDPRVDPASDPKPLPPEPMPDDACCGNGCDPCVLDFYQAELDQHRVALRAWHQRQVQTTPMRSVSSPSTPPTSV